MKRVKIRYIVFLVLFVMFLLMIYLYSNTNKLVLELEGYGFYKDINQETSNFQIKQVEVKINAYVNDSNINNDKIEISYDGIKVTENILLRKKEDGFWTGNIIHYDNVNEMDEILGKIQLFNKGNECFISLYNENLYIIIPEDDKEIARQKYVHYMNSVDYKLK